MDTTSRLKINKEILALKDTLNWMNSIDKYRTFHPETTEYTFFLIAHETLSRRDHIFGNKIRLNKFRKIKVISSIFSNHTV